MAVPTFDPSIQKTALLVQNLLNLKKKKSQSNNDDDRNSTTELPFDLEYLVSDYIDAQKKFTSGINNFMHRVDWEQDELASTEMILETCPEIVKVPSVSVCNDDDDDDDDDDAIFHFLPIYVAASQPNAVDFVPLLLKIGLEQGVGGKEGRGGLMVNSSTNNGICPLLYIIQNDDVETVKALMKMDLLIQNEVYPLGHQGQRFSLLHLAAIRGSLKIVKFLVKLDHSCLLTYHESMNPLDASTYYCTNGSMNIRTARYLLRKTLQYYPTHQSIGGLFPVESDSIALENLIEEFGEHATWDIIEKSLSRLKDPPTILHKVIKHVPDQILNAIQRFPQSVFLRDDQHRLPVHVALEGGLQWSDELVSLLNASMPHLKDRDPVTEFYPFALAASEPSCDLKTIMYLLKLHPTQGQESIARRKGPTSDDRSERERKRRKIDS